ncbi:MAG: outer membrane protein assembly factor BamD [Gammaproteobacteria bacterium]|nr:outer membrane protein assembly factor BamD [Gammaproteobacteria bacterium]
MRALKLIPIILLILITGCSLLPEQIDETKSWSAQRIYERAQEAMRNQNYEAAIKYFESLEARYPFGRYAQQALIETAYAYYKFSEPDSAVATADRFIKIYPQHPHTDYAYYLKGLANFSRGDNFIDKYLPRDPSERDPGASRQSFLDFAELIKRFPRSQYAKDAGLRMAFLRNNLGWYEVHVADYYMRRGAHIAAINRCKHVLNNYPQTPAIPRALEIMIEAYKILDMDDLAADAQKVLDLNTLSGT